MRFAEMGCMMTPKKLDRKSWLVAQQEKQKEVEGRLDGRCRQAKQFCVETFCEE